MSAKSKIQWTDATWNLRRAQLAKIHLAKKRLGLSDDLYRAVIRRVTGKTSSADLDSRERGRLLDEFTRLGFANTPAPRREAGAVSGAAPSALAGPEQSGGDPQLKSPAAPQIGKIRALWKVLVNAGAIRASRAGGAMPAAAESARQGITDEEKALRRFVKRQTGRDALEWLTAADANKIIEGLKKWIVRISSNGRSGEDSGGDENVDFR